MMTLNPSESLLLSISILCMGMLVKALEDLRSCKLFSDNGLLSWRVLRTESRSSFVQSRLLEFIFGTRTRTLIFLVIRVCLALLAILLFLFYPKDALLNLLGILLTLLLFGAQYLLSLRSKIGLDGAHQMGIIILVGFCIGMLFPTEPIQIASCLFIGTQLILSYFVAGVAKLVSHQWRSGVAIHWILWTRTYGLGVNVPLLNGTLGVVACWSVILFEVTFPFSLLHSDVALIWLGIGVCFHIGNAVLMGLNGFLFAFLAAYPSFLAALHFVAECK
jgi:hypothetical protein